MYVGLMLHFYRTELLVCAVGSAASVALKQIWSQRQEFRGSGRLLAQVAWVEGVTQPSQDCLGQWVGQPTSTQELVT